MARVISVGAITVDVTSFSDRLPKPGETLLGTEFTLVPGGKGANQAVAAARAGASTAMVGCVGDDHFAELALANLAAEQIDASGVGTVPGMTGVAHIRVDASAENDIVVIPLANTHLTPERVAKGLSGVCPDDVIVVQLEVPLAASLAAIEAGRAAGARVILDPAPAVAGLPDDVWAGLYAVTPNETEATIVTGISVDDEESAIRAGNWFRERGVDVAIITLASKGAVVVSDDGTFAVPAYRVTAVDTTAAGDAFTGYLAAGLSQGKTLGDAVKGAMAAGALAVTVSGASSSLPRVDRVREFLAAQTQPGQ